MASATGTATIVNERGLHARAAARFVAVASRFECEILVSHLDLDVSGRSIMGLMMLAAGPGAEVGIRADGVDAEAAVSALVGLVVNGFDDT